MEIVAIMVLLMAYMWVSDAEKAMKQKLAEQEKNEESDKPAERAA